MSNMAQKQESKNQNKGLSEKAQQNLAQLDLDLTTHGAYFKAEPGKIYVIRINPEDRIEKVENTRFAFQDPKTGQTKVPVRYEFKIMHVGNGAEQLWDTSLTVCKTILDILSKGFTVLQ